MTRIASICTAVVILAGAWAAEPQQLPGPPPPQRAPSGQPPQAQPPNAQPPKATASIRGRVFVADSGQPLRNAQISLDRMQSVPAVPTAGFQRTTATTDADGVYQFANLPPGRYIARAAKSPYIDLAWGQTQPADRSSPFDLAEGQAVDHIDFALPRGAVITGRVLDEFGEPMTGIQVAPVQMQSINGQTRAMSGRVATTNDIGEFRLYGIRPGQYAVQATWRPGPMTLPEHVGYPTTYFPGTTDAAAAQKFTVRSGQTTSGVVMTLSPTTVAKITGTAVDSHGKTVSGGIMLDTASGGGFSSRGTGMRPDGTFVITGVLAGDYVLRVQGPGGPNGPQEMALMPLSVGTEDVTDLQLVTLPPSKITGRIVVDAGAAPVPLVPPQLTAIPMNQVVMIGGPMPRATAAEDLSFELSAWPGRTRITATSLPSMWMVRAIRVDGVDVIDEGIDVKSGQNVKGVEIEITSRVTTLTGVVTNTRGEPVKNGFVIAFPVDAKRTTPNSRYVRVSGSDQEGRYRITGLPAGDYQLIAMERVEPGRSPTDPEFLERIRSSASGVVLVEGETRTVDLRIYVP